MLMQFLQDLLQHRATQSIFATSPIAGETFLYRSNALLQNF